MPRRSTLIMCGGGLILLAAAVMILEPWAEGLRWRDSSVALQAERNAAAPTIVPPRATATVGSQSVAARPALPRAVPTPMVVATATPQSPPLSRVTSAPVQTPVNEPTSSPPTAAPTPTLGPPVLRVADVAFQFQDPPQPGANVQLTAVIHNPGEAPGGPVSIDLPAAWLSGYAIRGIEPLPADGTLNGQHLDRTLRFTFDGPPAGGDLQVVVFLVTTDEVIDAPDLRVLDGEGRELGHGRPPTEAPPAQPGPVYAIDIPRLHLHTGVVQVEWEPPLFVVGQVRASAHVTEGNSVLVGHVRGAAGYNVFDHLDQLQVGDQVVASSRGETFAFVVSQTQVLPEEDLTPTDPTATPRLTLMTCAGDWNPLTMDYSQRLWVIAEPVSPVAHGPTEANAPFTLP